MSVLIVVAHPDDEVLGCGGAAAALARAGEDVRACILAGEANARRNRPATIELKKDMLKANKILGMRPPILGSFPNIMFNTVPHLETVQFIEDAILSTGSGVIFTHHPSDLNIDHQYTSSACQAAARLFQRREDVPRLKALYFMEVASATDWALGSASSPFIPDTFFSIGDLIEVKIRALRAYRGVLRQHPHPRSETALRSISVYRGGQSGYAYAEAFQTAFRASEHPSDII